MTTSFHACGSSKLRSRCSDKIMPFGPIPLEESCRLSAMVAPLECTPCLACRFVESTGWVSFEESECASAVIGIRIDRFFSLFIGSFSPINVYPCILLGNWISLERRKTVSCCCAFPIICGCNIGLEIRFLSSAALLLIRSTGRKFASKLINLAPLNCPLASGGVAYSSLA